MQSDLSFERRFRYQELAIARLMCEARLLRDQNADLLAQLEAARRPRAAAAADHLVETLPAGPGAPATARAALTRWLTGQVPGEVLADARLLASELVANSAGTAERLEEGSSLQFAVQLKDGAIRVDVRGLAERPEVPAAPAREPGGGFGLQLVEALATRWGADRTGGTHLWFEVPAVGAAA